MNRALAVLFFSAFALLPPSVHSQSGDEWPPRLTVLAKNPKWHSLDKYQFTISRSAFERMLYSYYSPDKSFCEYLDISPECVVVYREKEKKTVLWKLNFAPPISQRENLSHYYPFRILGELKGITPKRPLEGLKIALDPGHIGGAWAQMEERSFQISKDTPVEEAHLNLLTCELLAKNLEQAGATVLWTKRDFEPVTALRPIDLKEEAALFALRKNPKIANYVGKPQALKALQWSSELLFYRVAEIQARASKLNRNLNPDLTICVHYNAAGWRNPKRPVLYSHNNLLIFVNGNYLKSEIVYDDIKYDLFKKLLEKSIGTEISIADSIGRRMRDYWPQWKAGQYGRDGKSVGTSGYVWSRNLLANRLFEGPVIFVEGPFMNNKDVYPRLIAGDYEGTQKIRGKDYRSIYREFADIVASGIIDYYAKKYDLRPRDVWTPISFPSPPYLEKIPEDGAVEEPQPMDSPSPLMNLDAPAEN